ncbi:DNA-binding protein [Paraburkholderia tagetis]|uniref:DNA-binding protein n=1 Tax=Paraburkholderia tagetis TaxID=2913261 RepID=A0A9X1UG95_9BURK|nr:DNA-binding protein [Paraburkholderia tagetis]MCG5072262.1 DNA-binding protein [Paraburkholderia tagetis]
MNEIEFKSAFDAVRFALSYSSQQYGESPMAKRMRGEAAEPGMGLIGLTGAGQAGLIRREMWELPDLHLSVLVARAAPHDIPCSCGAACCSGRVPNVEWVTSVSWLTAASAAHCSGFSHYRVRRAIIERIFGVKCSLVDIAKEYEAHANTVSNHNTAVRRWLEGNKKTGEQGVCDVAWAAMERRLDELGILKAPENA